MSTVPNTSIVDAAVTALAPFHPENREQVADMLLFWRHRAELTPADITGVQDRLFPPACPDWCLTDHTEDDVADLVLHQGGDHGADSHVRRLLQPHKLDIRVSRTDSPEEGRVGKPALYVVAELELTTWEQAAELARTILDSYGYLEGADRA